MGKPLSTIEYCYLNNFEVRHGSYQITMPDPSPSAPVGATVQVNRYRVFANFQFDLLDASKVLINRAQTKLTLQEDLTADLSAAALIDVVGSSANVIKAYIASVKADKSGFVS